MLRDGVQGEPLDSVASHLGEAWRKDKVVSDGRAVLVWFTVRPVREAAAVGSR